jgi:hypothetical protein
VYGKSLSGADRELWLAIAYVCAMGLLILEDDIYLDGKMSDGAS